MEARNVEKSKLLYDTIDSSSFYLNKVERRLALADERPVLPRRRIAQRRFPGRRESARDCCN